MTQDFIQRVLSKITFIGAIFLGVVAILPIITGNLTGTGIQMGGTSLLIIVGVALENSSRCSRKRNGACVTTKASWNKSRCKQLRRSLTMNIVLLGAPGAGKGTQAEMICDRLHIPETFHEAVSFVKLSKTVQRWVLKLRADMDAGDLVPDEVIFGILHDRLGTG